MDAMNMANVAWVMASTALVMVMLPGLSLFYSGLVRGKNALATAMHSFTCLGIVLVVWVLWGYSLAFGSSVGGIIGNLDHLFLNGVGLEPRPGQAIPELLFMLFQGMFAVITPALLAGAIAERVKFRAFGAFVVLWVTFVYCPIAHWVWGGGWLHEMGASDFAGGFAVHMSSGVAALAAARILGRRIIKEGETALQPHSLMIVLLGAGLLWFGWFGFNGGSALAADGVAVQALVNTNVAAAAGALTWLLLTWYRTQKPQRAGRCFWRHSRPGSRDTGRRLRHDHASPRHRHRRCARVLPGRREPHQRHDRRCPGRLGDSRHGRHLGQRGARSLRIHHPGRRRTIQRQQRLLRRPSCQHGRRLDLRLCGHLDHLPRHRSRHRPAPHTRGRGPRSGRRRARRNRLHVRSLTIHTRCACQLVHAQRVGFHVFDNDIVGSGFGSTWVYPILLSIPLDETIANLRSVKFVCPPSLVCHSL